jgi:small-conductance mechanosensitive channel
MPDRFPRLVRGIVGLLFAVAVTIVPLVAAAADESPKANASAGTPSAPLTAEAVRELVARMPDAEVRKLLIEQLDRAAVGEAKTSGTDAGMGVPGLGTMHDNTGMVRERAMQIGAAALALPATTAAALERLREPEVSRVAFRVAGILAAMWIAGAVAELIWRRAARDWRARHVEVAHKDVFARALALGIALAADMVGVIVFALAALGVYLAFWHTHETTRILALALTAALLFTRAVALAASLLLAPKRPERRLLPLGDPPARTLFRFVVAITALTVFGFVIVRAVARNAADPALADALTLLVAIAGLIITLWTIWKVREPIAELIRGDRQGGSAARIAADLWPIAATFYVLAVFAGRAWEVLAGVSSTMSGTGIMSLVILVAVPVVDYALCRYVAALAAADRPEGPVQAGSLLRSYEPVVRKVIHIVVIVLGLVWLAQLWDLDLFAIAQQSFGGRVASALLGIGIVLLVAFMLWEIAKTAIDRRLAEDQGRSSDTPASRLRTLLPLLRMTILITITIMAVLSVLAALGVDILPLLAGASIVGVAIGFGSQTLVRDIVSGAFFLMDDAFRLGEYIEVGDAKGRIEKITLRALFLRHHRGALNILPFGEIKRMRNTSRDWMIMVMEFRLAFDTDLKKVKKLLKAIGEEISADPELGPELLQPLKSQGVMSTDDSAMVVRAKYMARPGNAPFMIRRMAYEKILKAFAQNGIEFASRRVAVYVPPGADEYTKANAAAAAIAHDADKGPRSVVG